MPRRVLLRMKKLRRYLDERIREARATREASEDEPDAREAGARIEAFQEVRQAMVGERLEEDGGDAETEASREAG